LRTDYDIVSKYDFQRVTNINSERSINLFMYLDPEGKKDKTSLPTSGLENTDVSFAPTTGGFRGTNFIFNNFMYVVIGTDVWRLSTTLTPLRINGAFPLSIAANGGYVGIDANTFQIIFVDGQKGYIWDTITELWSQITDPAFPLNPIDVCYLDGFFVVANGGTNTFQLSSFNQGLIWGPDFTTGTGNSFVATSGGSPNLVLTSGTTLNYQIGTPITFNGSGTLPVGTPPLVIGQIYYVKSVIDGTHFTISATDGGTAITFSTTGTAPIFVTNSGQLQLGAITSHPGTIVACRTLHRRLFLFSQNFTEVWENQGIGANLPFRRINSALMEYGTPAVGSIKVGFDKMFFLSQDKDGLGAVMMVIGTEAVPISNRALDFALANYASNPSQGVADCTGVLIKENGLIFFRLNFTAANHTYVYNVTLSNPLDENGKIWHEEEVLNGNRHPAQTHGYFNGINYFGHYSQPTLYVVDSTFVDNDGELIRRAIVGRPQTIPTYNRRRIDRFHLDLVQGQVENPATNVAPQVFLSISKDGAQSFGNQIRAPMGQIGQRTFRTVWRKLGTIPRGQSFVPYIQFFTRIPFIVLGAAWDYEDMPE
jgi:hypothetical protein